jgi:hypothetical protein
MADLRKRLSAITRTEWIAIRWIEVTEYRDEDRMFVPEHERTPSEAMQAMREWDETEVIRKAMTSMLDFEASKPDGGAVEPPPYSETCLCPMCEDRRRFIIETLIEAIGNNTKGIRNILGGVR